MCTCHPPVRYPLKVVKWTSPGPLCRSFNEISTFFIIHEVASIRIILTPPLYPSAQTCCRVSGAIKTCECRSVTGISISHRRHVVWYTGRKTKMGVQNVRRGRQRCHWHSRDDKNCSGILLYITTWVRFHNIWFLHYLFVKE